MLSREKDCEILKKFGSINENKPTKKINEL